MFIFWLIAMFGPRTRKARTLYRDSRKTTDNAVPHCTCYKAHALRQMHACRNLRVFALLAALSPHSISLYPSTTSFGKSSLVPSAKTQVIVLGPSTTTEGML